MKKLTIGQVFNGEDVKMFSDEIKENAIVEGAMVKLTRADHCNLDENDIFEYREFSSSDSVDFGGDNTVKQLVSLNQRATVLFLK